MLHAVFHFVLVNGVRVASAILPATPLLGRKLLPAPVTSFLINPTHRTVSKMR